MRDYSAHLLFQYKEQFVLMNLKLERDLHPFKGQLKN